MRLTRITTRTGDEGITGLADGQRLPKHHPRIALMGELDELNCELGMLQALLPDPDIHELAPLLTRLQHHLFDLGGELAMPGHQALGEAALERLDQAIETLNSTLPPLKDFILPGGSKVAAQCHIARAKTRRVERQWTGTSHEIDGLNPIGQAYLNRLSDLLFIMARRLARDTGEEMLWHSGQDA